MVKLNKKATTAFFLLMMGIVFFLLGLALANPIKEVAGDSRTELNCTNTTISNQNKAVCTQFDLYQPVYVGLLFGLAGVLIGALIK